MTEPSPFIEGWNFVQVLGEGAYGEVKLAVNEDTKAAVAVKLIAISEDSTRNAEIKKETLIQKMCTHDNVIRLWGSRQDSHYIYLLLEYASGGELFDRIEPDIGMEFSECQRLFKQLISAVYYMFSKGISHRDIKPENCLLDEFDNLKLTDFGLATVFRHKGQERMLDKSCGTYPYVAPEVLAGIPHPAQPSDIWSCGIVLVAMLAGELPWDQPSAVYIEYKNWVDNDTSLPPFNKIDMFSLSFLTKILEPNYKRRYNINELKSHKWFTVSPNTLKRPVLTAKHANSLGKRMKSSESLSQSDQSFESPTKTISLSQPETSHAFTGSQSAESTPSEARIPSTPIYSFSQPVNPESMLLSQVPCSQSQSSQSSSKTSLQRLVKRMTRYYVIGDYDQVVTALLQACTRLGFKHKKNSYHMFTITTLDRRNMTLTFKICLLDLDGLLLDFRLSKGDGIEFKKCFIKLKKELDYLVCYSKQAPMLSQTSQSTSQLC